MLRNDDSYTELREIRLHEHWRVVVCVLVGGIVSTVIWQYLFPHTSAIKKLWAGCSTGMTVGMLPGTLWHLCDEKRRATSSGMFFAMEIIVIFIWGAFACLSIFCIAPDFEAEEKERLKVRSLSVANISAISIQLDDDVAHRVEDAEFIAMFVGLATQAELFYSNHEGSVQKMQIRIDFRDGTSIRYFGRVPERHEGDFAISFRAYYSQGELLFPNGRQLLNSFAR